MKLPNPDQAIMPTEKLEGYSLNRDHSEGRHKAIVFQSALGLNQNNAEDLRAALRQALKTHDAIPTKRTAYGQKYQIDFDLTRNNSTALIRSVWILRHNETIPRLITCYIP